MRKAVGLHKRVISNNYFDECCIAVARRLAWGKLMNSGQVCIAPDYVLCHKDVKDVFLNELKWVYAYEPNLLVIKTLKHARFLRYSASSQPLEQNILTHMLIAEAVSGRLQWCVRFFRSRRFNSSVFLGI